MESVKTDLMDNLSQGSVLGGKRSYLFITQ